MSKDLFKNLIEAVVALAADEVVKLLDRNRGPHADLAKVLYVDMGAAEHIVKRQPFEVQLRLLDGKREPVADAARNLHMVHGFDEVQLNWGCRESIIGKAVALNRPSIGDIKGGMRCVGIHPVYTLWKPAYPDRERTADSAQYLWKNKHSGDWVSLLQRYTSEDIRSTACNRQKALCAEVADAAWKCFDSGYWQAHHFIYNNVSAKRIIESAEAIKDFTSRAAPAPRKMIGVLKLDGLGKFGQAVKVEGIPVFDDSGASSDPECEFVKSSADNHGMTVVTGIAFSFGPGIYQ